MRAESSRRSVVRAQCAGNAVHGFARSFVIGVFSSAVTIVFQRKKRTSEIHTIGHRRELERVARPDGEEFALFGGEVIRDHLMTPRGCVELRIMDSSHAIVDGCKIYSRKDER